MKELTMREQVIAWLQENVSEHRLQHILGVEQMCIQLAHCYQVEAQKAAQAGLMHDLAKFFPPSKLLSMAHSEGIVIDPVCQANPHLLHADVSAIVAREQFGVTDEEILTAIANHTLGNPQMSDLSCIVYVADALEPNRGDTPELEAMRQVSQQNLYKSVQQTCDYSLKYLLSTGKLIHPRAILTRNWALQLTKSSQAPDGNSSKGGNRRQSGLEVSTPVVHGGNPQDHTGSPSGGTAVQDRSASFKSRSTDD